MKSLDDLLVRQGELEIKYADFVQSLDQKRTVTLRQLLTEPLTLQRLRAPWLKPGIIAARFEALGAFLARIDDHPRLRDSCRLIFLQANTGQGDTREHRRIQAQSSHYASMYGKLPPQFSYLHPSNKWLGLTSTLRQGRRRIRPLSNYATYTYRDVMRTEPSTLAEAESAADAALGYPVPNWPKLLGVSDEVATDYLLRPVIHDIGHGRLPSLNPSIDSLHNATMLYAMGTVENTHDSPWETMVHRECTDPFFYVDGAELLEECAALNLTPLQRYYLRRLRRWYTGPAHEMKKVWLWNINPDSSSKEARAQMRVVLEEMCADGFGRYALKP
jgi:hypothetical protein